MLLKKDVNVSKFSRTFFLIEPKRWGSTVKVADNYCSLKMIDDLENNNFGL